MEHQPPRETYTKREYLDMVQEYLNAQQILLNNGRIYRECANRLAESRNMKELEEAREWMNERLKGLLKYPPDKN